MNLEEIFKEIRSYVGNDTITGRFIVRNEEKYKPEFWVIDNQINLKYLFLFSYDDFVNKNWSLHVEYKKGFEPEPKTKDEE